MNVIAANTKVLDIGVLFAIDVVLRSRVKVRRERIRHYASCSYAYLVFKIHT